MHNLSVETEISRQSSPGTAQHSRAVPGSPHLGTPLQFALPLLI